MKRNVLLVFSCCILSFMLSGCLKSKNEPVTCIANNTGIPTAEEIASLQSYITSNSLTATKDPGGFFYSISFAGSGVTPVSTSTITVKYSGTLTNGTEFDKNKSPNGDTFPLAQLILGWQKGIPLIKKGGSIKLYLPPSLAYGCNAIGIIPAGSNLIFNIELVDVQ